MINKKGSVELLLNKNYLDQRLQVNCGYQNDQRGFTTEIHSKKLISISTYSPYY